MTVGEVDVLDKARQETEELDIFSDKLLETLYELGLMPCILTRKPASYEKYPQELLNRFEINRLHHRDGLIKAFDEWRSNILRKPRYSQTRQDAVLKIEALRTWVIQHDTLLLNKHNIRHLRKSMFGRTYTYLYPRLTLIMEYRDYCREHRLLDETVQVRNIDGREHSLLRAVADEGFVAEHLPLGTVITQAQITDALGAHTVPNHLKAAQAFLIQNEFYFQSVFKGQVRDDQQQDNIQIEEELEL